MEELSQEDKSWINNYFGYTDEEVEEYNKTMEDQNIKTTTQGTSTEAPLSIHIDTYFKGFHAGITIRKEDNSKVPVVSIKNAVESLIEAGFEPSWNKTTSIEHLEPKAPQNAPQEATAPTATVCGIHGTPLTLIPAGVSKKTGKPYNSFYICNTKNADGSSCSFKPTK